MQLQQKNVWLPIVASVGIGAAAYYSMTRSGRGVGKTLQQMIPMMPSMSGSQPNQQTSQQPQQNQQQIDQGIEKVLS